MLYPAISYPSYAMGAELAGCRAVPVPVTADGRSDLAAIDPADAERALCLWVNSPANPTGHLDDLGAAAEWGRAHGVPVLSDECYVEFTWDGPGRTILEHGLDGVLAVHSLSKRSNLAGVRAGFYAGDPDLVHYLSELRKHAGFMVPGPVQAAAVAAWADEAHVDEQRAVYLRRLERFAEILAGIGVDAPMPGGGFYLWAPAPDGDAWALVRRLADRGRRPRVARASSTAPTAPASCGWRWCSPTTASSWWPAASAWPGETSRVIASARACTSSRRLRKKRCAAPRQGPPALRCTASPSSGTRTPASPPC